MKTPSDKVIEIESGAEAREICQSELEKTLRAGAQRLLAEAIEAEVAEYLAAHMHERDEGGRRRVMRNGHHREREVITGVGAVRVRAPRVDDRAASERFRSTILPRYLRKSPSLENLIPSLYLHGVSGNDMAAALEAILGPGARGLSATTVGRLKEVWQAEFGAWSRRDLTGQRYVYLWADGIYFNVRCEDARPCILVLVGAREDGVKELVAVVDGERESAASWEELLLDLKTRGLAWAPAIAVGDGALGFWSALARQWPEAAAQRCWVHKTANVLDKLPKKLHGAAKDAIHQIYLAETRADACAAFDTFGQKYSAKYPKAWHCLEKDRSALLAFYDFPAAHWIHLRTTNVIESSFSMVRHRTRQTKGCGSRAATLALVYKLGRECENKWRRLNAQADVAKIVRGIRFTDGLEVLEQAA